jgi:hypothetical protein
MGESTLKVISVAIPESAYDAIIMTLNSDENWIPTITTMDPPRQHFLVWPDPDIPEKAIALIRGVEEIVHD